GGPAGGVLPLGQARDPPGRGQGRPPLAPGRLLRRRARRRRGHDPRGRSLHPGRALRRVVRPMSLLSVRNVTLRFGGIAALEDVSFDVEEGTTAGLIGPNGAGKTTTFNVITRLYRVDDGDVVMDGHSLLRTPPSRVINHGIARTFQNVELFGTM